jgi:hypothetical protein
MVSGVASINVVENRPGTGIGREQLGHRLDLHVAVLQLPLVIRLQQHGPDQRMIEGSPGKMPTTSARSCGGFAWYRTSALPFLPQRNPPIIGSSLALLPGSCEG